MLSQFHARHPMGSIITDLLQVEEGIFIVKAQVIVNNTVLGTGLAGSTTVEAAEDAALQRALDHAGFTKAQLASFSAQPPSAGTPYSPPPATISPAAYSPPRTPSTPTPQNGHAWSPPDPITPAAETYANAYTSPTPRMPESSQSDPEDVSDLMVQTDVEMQRIGWGAKEGRKFLEDHYNKKSRSYLSPAELQDFLTHLKGMGRNESPF